MDNNSNKSPEEIKKYEMKSYSFGFFDNFMFDVDVFEDGFYHHVSVRQFVVI